MTAQTENRQEKCREEDLHADDQDRRSDDRETFVGQRSETVGDPRRDDDSADHDADEHERATEQQAVLEPKAAAHTIEPGVLLAHEVRAVGVRAETEREHLRADDHQQRAPDQRVQAPRATQHVDARAGDRDDQRAESGEQHAGHDEEVIRAVDEQEAQVAPAVAKARQLALASARVVFDRELGDLELLLRRSDHHLGGELHAGRAQVQAREHVSAQGAHAAVRVADPRPEEQVQQTGENRVADIAVQPRHRAGLDVVHAVADDHLGALLERRDEARDLLEVIRQVGVGHHDVAPARSGEAGQIRAAVAAPAFDHDARSRLLGEPRRVVLGVVVGDDDLARDAHAHERLERGGDARLDVLRLVEAWDHHRHQR